MRTPRAPRRRDGPGRRRRLCSSANTAMPTSGSTTTASNVRRAIAGEIVRARRQMLQDAGWTTETRRLAGPLTAARGRRDTPTAPIASRLRNTARSSSDRARRIAAAQFTATPSASASAASSTIGRRSRMGHRFRQADQRTAQRDARGVRRHPAADECELVIAVAKLDAPDNQAAIVRAQRREGAPIARCRFLANGGVKRRGRVGRRDGVDLQMIEGRSHAASNLVGDAILNCAAEVRLQGAMPARLEAVESAERLQESVLHDVGGIGCRTRPARQPPVRPPEQRRKLSLEQRVERRAIAAAGAPQQPQRGPRRCVIGAACRTHIRALTVRCHSGTPARAGERTMILHGHEPVSSACR